MIELALGTLGIGLFILAWFAIQVIKLWPPKDVVVFVDDQPIKYI